IVASRWHACPPLPPRPYEGERNERGASLQFSARGLATVRAYVDSRRLTLRRLPSTMDVYRDDNSDRLSANGHGVAARADRTSGGPRKTPCSCVGLSLHGQVRAKEGRACVRRAGAWQKRALP